MSDDTMQSTKLWEKLTEMETLAWASRSEDELVEWIANEVWKRPYQEREFQRDGKRWEQSGRVGFSAGKITRFVRRFTVGRSNAEKRRIRERVEKRTTEVFYGRIADWSEQVLAKILLDRKKLSGRVVDTAITRTVPRGARKQVKDYVLVALGRKPTRNLRAGSGSRT